MASLAGFQTPFPVLDNEFPSQENDMLGLSYHMELSRRASHICCGANARLGGHMQNEFTVMNPSSVGERKADTQPINDEMNQVRSTVEQTRHSIKVARREFDEHVEKFRFGVRVLWAVVILLAATLIGFSWFGHSDLKEYGTRLAQLPALQNVASVMSDRLAATEGTLTDWRNDQTSLTERMARLEMAVSSNLRGARNQAQSFANQIGQRIRDEINQKLERLQSRIGNVESVQRETQDHVAQLQTEIGDMLRDMTSMQQQNAQKLSELQEAKQATQADMNTVNSQVTTINNQVITHANRLNAISNQMGRDRVAFEVFNNRTQQVAPGIYVTVKHTDVAHQRVDGWLQLADEGRIFWIRGLGSQETFQFVTRTDNRTHELVFTAIQETGATGYLLLPTPMSLSPVGSN